MNTGQWRRDGDAQRADQVLSLIAADTSGASLRLPKRYATAFLRASGVS